MAKNYNAAGSWYTVEQVLASGKPYRGFTIGYNGYDEEIAAGKVFISKTAASRIGLSVKKDDEPDVFIFTNAGPGTKKYMPLYDRTEFFEAYPELGSELLKDIDNLHLVRKSELKYWKIKRSKGLPIVGYITEDFVTEVVFDISDTDEYEMYRLERMMKLMT